jgi:putative hydrolase of the HAD superfamily
LKYRHIFFDLDLTIWDFNRNSAEAINELFDELKISEYGNITVEEFIPVYRHYNEILWDQYRKGLVEKDDLRLLRFQQSLSHFGINNIRLATEMGDGYVEKGPAKTYLFPFALESLEYLQEKYKLHIITNGFQEVQFLKLENSGIRKYFDQVITSEMAGSKKPDRKIFHYSLYRAKAKSKQSIMIGDHLEIDIDGARNAGMDQVYFNPEKKQHREKPTFEIDCLGKLRDIF